MQSVNRRRRETIKGPTTRRRGPHMAFLAVGTIMLGALAGTAGQALATTAMVKTTLVDVRVITVAKYGKILVDSAGLALYYDTANKPGHWACTGDCLTTWPPLTLPKGHRTVAAGPGVTGLGTVKGPSGVQVTWHGKALYTYVKDSKGTVRGQGVFKVWFVVQLKAGSTSPATTGSSWA